MVIFWPKYRSTHPENYLFSLCKQMFSGSKYPKNILFNFEKRSTVGHMLFSRSVTFCTRRHLRMAAMAPHIIRIWPLAFGFRQGLWRCAAVISFLPKCLLGHPKNRLFLFYKSNMYRIKHALILFFRTVTFCTPRVFYMILITTSLMRWLNRHASVHQTRLVQSILF